MTNEVPIELKLTPNSKRLYDDLQKLISNASPINLKVDISSQTLAGLRNQLRTDLNNAPINIINIKTTDTTVNLIRKQVEEGLNKVPIRLSNITINTDNIVNQVQQALQRASFDVNIGGRVSRGVTTQPGTPTQDPGSLDQITQNIINRRVAQGERLRLGVGRADPTLSSFESAILSALNQSTSRRLGPSEITVPRPDLGTSEIDRAQALSGRARQRFLSGNLVNPFLFNRFLETGQQAAGELDIQAERRLALASQAEQDAIERRIDQFRIKTAPRSGINDFQKQQEAEEKAIQANRHNVLRAQSHLDRQGLLGNVGDTAARFGVHPDVLRKESTFDTLKRNLFRGEVGEGLAHGALLSTVRGDFPSLFGGLLGGAAGGALTGTRQGAEFGSTVGIDLVSSSIRAFELLKDTLFDAAQAGLTFQRSILGISSILSQSSEFVGAGGAPVSTGRQVDLQRQRARGIQLRARAEAAQVGIGGESESALVQAILTGFGSRGIELNESQAATVTARLGAALNIFAPELANQANVVRRDVFDITRGVGQAGRTALGSRIPRVVEALKTAQTGDDVLRATKELENLITVFKNSGDAITQIQRLNAVIEITRTNFGEAFVEQIATGLQALTGALNNEQTARALQALGSGIGIFTNQVLKFSAAFIEIMPNFITSLSGVTGRVLSLNLGELASPLIDPLLGPKSAGGLQRLEGLTESNLLGSFIEGRALGALAGPGPLQDILGLIAAGTQEDLANVALNRTTSGQTIRDNNGRVLGVLDNNGRLIRSPQAKTLESTSVRDLLTRAGAKPEELDVTLSSFARESSEFKASQSSLAAERLRSTLRGAEGEARSPLQARLITANRITSRNLAAADQAELEAALPTLTGRLEATQASRVGERVGLAEESVRVAQQAVTEAPDLGSRQEAIFALREAELDLSKARKEAFENTKAAADIENEISQLRAQSIERVSAKGRIEGIKADVDVLFDRADREQDPIRRAALQTQAETAQTEVSGKIIDLGNEAINLKKTFLDLQTATQKHTDTVISNNSALAENVLKLQDLGKEEALSKLEGVDKAIALAGKIQEEGGILTSEQTAGLEKLAPGASTEALFGLSNTFRQEKSRGLQLDLAIAQADPDRIKNQFAGRAADLRNEQQDLLNKLAKSSLDLAQAQINAFGALDKLKNLGDLAALTQSIGDLIKNLSTMTEALSVDKFAKAISGSMRDTLTHPG